jgi:putative ABC transport system permease protein
VGVINEALAREYFSGRNPIGARVRAIGFAAEPWVTVVGVVANEKKPELLHEMSWHEQSVLYHAFAQAPLKSAPLVVRMAGVVGTAYAIDQTITDLDIDIPTGMHPMLSDLLGTYLKYPRFRAIVIGAFAALALTLAAVGLYGLLAQLVVQRTHEIGIRMAVGARTTDVLGLIARQGGVPVLAGLAMGIGFTAVTARFLKALLYGINPVDPITLASVSVALLAAALIAMAVPARRAVRVDPMIALRHE